MPPIQRGRLTNDQRAGEGGKGHRDGRQGYPNPSASRRRRGVRELPGITACGNKIPPAPVTRAFVRGATRLTFRQFVDRGCHTADSLRQIPVLELLLVECRLN